MASGESLIVKRKYCYYCKRTLPVGQFHRDGSRSDGLCNRCKKCNNDYTRKHQKAHRGKRRQFELKHYYGITVEEYNSLMKKQKNVCAICGLKPEKYLAVDHCHKSGKVRGLLCRKCNSAIGLLDDSSIRLRAATLYLRKHSG